MGAGDIPLPWIEDARNGEMTRNAKEEVAGLEGGGGGGGGGVEGEETIHDSRPCRRAVRRRVKRYGGLRWIVSGLDGMKVDGGGENEKTGHLPQWMEVPIQRLFRLLRVYRLLLRFPQGFLLFHVIRRLR